MTVVRQDLKRSIRDTFAGVTRRTVLLSAAFIPPRPREKPLVLVELEKAHPEAI